MKHATLVAFASLLLIAACNRQAPETAAAPGTADGTESASAAESAATDAATATEPSAERVMPVTVAADAVLVGTAIDASGAAASPKAVYTLADTVHASAATGGKAGAVASVYWTFENGRSHKNEQKPVVGDLVSFEFSQADGMRPGKYSAEIDIDGVPVGIADFVVE